MPPWRRQLWRCIVDDLRQQPRGGFQLLGQMNLDRDSKKLPESFMKVLAPALGMDYSNYLSVKPLREATHLD